MLRRHVEQFRDDARGRLSALERTEQSNTRDGNDWCHGFVRADVAAADFFAGRDPAPALALR